MKGRADEFTKGGMFRFQLSLKNWMTVEIIGFVALGQRWRGDIEDVL